MTSAEILKKVESLANSENVAGMARFGIRPKKTFGIASPELKKLAGEIGKKHVLAQKLWQTEYHEADALRELTSEKFAKD